MRRTEQVERWLTSVERFVNEINGVIEQGHQQLQDTCLGSFCPKNLPSTYKIGKRIVNRLGSARDLRHMSESFFSISDFTIVERLPGLRLLMPELLVENTVGLDSAVERVWRCNKDENTQVIRLCGIGGVGKSTLSKKLSNEFHIRNHDFDVVIWAEVSRQEEGLYRETSRDDFRERFDLLRLGIHLQMGNQNSSKVIYTTRSMELCNAVEALETIEVKCLPPQQALKLFRMMVGENILNNDPELSELAEIIALTCGGLPLAFLTVGRATASRRNPREWHLAVELIHSNPSEIDGFGDRVFPLLKFSYDGLNNATAHKCFRYCYIFPKDYNVRIDELIGLWIGEGFFDGSNPRDQAEFIVGTLKLAYLLESDEYKQFVGMHDVVHDMALWLVRDQGKRKKKVLVTKGVTITYEEHKKWEEANWISLYGNQGLVELPLDIGNVKTLQYLNLSLTSKVELPASLTNLRSLRCLLLDYTTNLKRVPKEFDPVEVPTDDEVAFLQALECLNRINKLGITIFAAPSVDNIIKSYTLRSCIRKLTFMECNGLISLRFTQELGNLERLEIFRCCSLKEFKISEWCKLGNLRQDYIGVCPLLLNLDFLAYTRNLETLTILDCESLESVTSEIIAFPGLKTISLTYLRNLESICPLPRCFPSLSEIEVSQCSLLRQLPFDLETTLKEKERFFAVIWSLWLARNDIIFGGKTWDRAQTYELVKLRVATWAKAKWPRDYNRTLDTFIEPRLGAVLKCVKKTRPKVEWTNPVDGSMKFNVDGAASGCPGEAGIGGILRNSAGETKMMFSKSIEMGDSNLAEVLAIKQAFMMFFASNWNSFHSLVIESDSSNAVSWIQALNQALWRMRKWILQIEMLKRKVKRWEIKHVKREANQQADTLAKSGIGRDIDLANVWTEGGGLLACSAVSYGYERFSDKALRD
ncbi:Ribonuclease H domain - like 10 [Theobroma cacao]|nr:Ribonuclease H domain - like 10 [Theobroma cacao]